MSVLIKRNQVDGLVAMKALLDQINESYPANKVTTNIAKVVEQGENPANYNSLELLAELKTNVDNMLGDGAEGLSIPELKRQIDQLNAELNGGTYEQGAVGGEEATLPGFKNKVIKDVVRIEFTWNGSVATPVDATKITSQLTANQRLAAYTVNGEPIVSAQGEAITFNFDTKAFSASPHVLDVDASKASGAVNPTTGGIEDSAAVYTAFTGTFKVFPVGTWTLETLPAEALLDNSEIQLIAYGQALQKVILQLATDKNLINRIVEAVGETAVVDAVQDATKTIDTRLDRLEGTVDSDLSKVAVKVSQITGKPAGKTAAETVTKTTVIPSKAYVDEVDNAIKADIGTSSDVAAYNQDGTVKSGTVRAEINSIKERLIYNNQLIQSVKPASIVNSAQVTSDNNTISETAIVNKFTSVDSAAATLKQSFETFRDTTAPATYIINSKVTDTFTKITAVNNTYTDSYTNASLPEVVGKKVFNEQISEIKDSVTNLNNKSYQFSAIILAPAVTANATTGITAKAAETGPVSKTTPVLSAQHTRNLITNEQERAIKAETNLDDKTVDWVNIQTSAGIDTAIVDNGTTLQAKVNAEATHSANTLVASKQYVDDAVKVAVANAKKDTNAANRAMDARVDEIEAVTYITEKIAVNGTTTEKITLTQTPIVNNEIVIFVNGIGYFLIDGVYSISGKVITWNSTAAGFTLNEVIDGTTKNVIVKYSYRNTAKITPIA